MTEDSASAPIERTNQRIHILSLLFLILVVGITGGFAYFVSQLGITF